MRVIDCSNIDLISENQRLAYNPKTSKYYTTAEYKHYKTILSMLCKKVKIDPPYQIIINAGTGKDIDNIIKPILDVLQSKGVLKNDKHVRSLLVYKTETKNYFLQVDVTTLNTKEIKKC